jgi:hypothetical protein
MNFKWVIIILLSTTQLDRHLLELMPTLSQPSIKRKGTILTLKGFRCKDDAKFARRRQRGSVLCAEKTLVTTCGFATPKMEIDASPSTWLRNMQPNHL